MAITENDNFDIRAPKSTDSRYGKIIGGNSVPFVSVAEANAAITYRHIGLTTLIDTGSGPIEYWYKAGVTNSDLVIKFTGINSINGLVAPTQTFITGTTGVDFNILSSVGTHTFNIPNSSTSARGLLSSADWDLFNGKQPLLVNQTNIRSINGTSLLGSGDLVVSGGVTTLAAVGSTPNANAASISSSTLNLQPANASFPGVIDTNFQQFTGNKQFLTQVTFPGSFTTATVVSNVPRIKIFGGGSGNSLLALGGATSWVGPSAGVEGQVLASVPSSTYTDNTTAASTTISHAALNGFTATSYNATNTGIVLTKASTIYISAPPGAGTNTTIGSSYALYVNTGNVFMGSNLQAAGDINGAKYVHTTNTLTATTTTFDLTLTQGTFITVNLQSNITSMTSTTPTTVTEYTVKFKQDATGSRTITSWPTGTKWPNNTAPTMSTGANKVDIFKFFYDGLGNLYGSIVGQNY